MNDVINCDILNYLLCKNNIHYQDECINNETYISFSNIYNILSCHNKFKLYLLTYVFISFQKRVKSFVMLNSDYFNRFIFSNTTLYNELSDTYSNINIIDYCLLFKKNYKLFTMILTLLYIKDIYNVNKVTNRIIDFLIIEFKICIDEISKRQIHILTKNIALINLIVYRLYELYNDNKELINLKKFNKDIIGNSINFLYISSIHLRSRYLMMNIYYLYMSCKKNNNEMKYIDYIKQIYSVINYNWIIYHCDYNNCLFYYDFSNIYNYLLENGCFVLLKIKKLYHNHHSGRWVDTSNVFIYSSCNNYLIPEEEMIFHLEL